jgi:hypothetical protein
MPLLLLGEKFMLSKIMFFMALKRNLGSLNGNLIKFLRCLGYQIALGKNSCWFEWEVVDGEM